MYLKIPVMPYHLLTYTSKPPKIMGNKVLGIGMVNKWYKLTDPNQP